jgi:hypothetical protein
MRDRESRFSSKILKDSLREIKRETGSSRKRNDFKDSKYDDNADRSRGERRHRDDKSYRKDSRDRKRDRADRKRRRSPSSPRRADKASTNNTRGYILYPPPRKSAVNYQLSPKSHAIKAAELEYQTKRGSKLGIKEQSETYSSKLLYQPRETNEEKKLKE